jgi:hypothetical protein
LLGACADAQKLIAAGNDKAFHLFAARAKAMKI